MSQLAVSSIWHRAASRLFAAGLRLSAFAVGILATAFMLDAHAEWGVVSAFSCFMLSILRIQFERRAGSGAFSPAPPAKDR